MVIISAHRGEFNDKRVENSESAFAFAFDKKYSTEVDVRLTSDGMLVMSHDENMKRLFGVDKIIPKTKKEELSQLCTFEKYLELLKNSKTKLNAIHIKDIEEEKVVEKVCDAIIKFNVQDNCFIFANDEQSVPLIKYCQEKYPKIRLGVHESWKNQRNNSDKESVSVVWLDEPKETWITKEYVQKIKQNNNKVGVISPEIINPDVDFSEVEETWLKWIDYGVDCICTDLPAKLEKTMKVETK